MLRALQRRHIGSALIEAGLTQIRQQGALGCILTGNPEYYRRFGFELCAEHLPINESEEYFMLKPFGSKPARGRFEFHPAFYEEGVDS